jgi:hypothetical protein
MALALIIFVFYCDHPKNIIIEKEQTIAALSFLISG